MKGPACKLDQRITLKLFAAGAAMCLFSENKDAYRPIHVFYLGNKEQRYYSSSKKFLKKSSPSVWGWDATRLTGNLGSTKWKHLVDVILQDWNQDKRLQKHVWSKAYDYECKYLAYIYAH